MNIEEPALAERVRLLTACRDDRVQWKPPEHPRYDEHGRWPSGWVVDSVMLPEGDPDAKILSCLAGYDLSHVCDGQEIEEEGLRMLAKWSRLVELSAGGDDA